MTAITTIKHATVISVGNIKVMCAITAVLGATEEITWCHSPNCGASAP